MPFRERPLHWSNGVPLESIVPVSGGACGDDALQGKTFALVQRNDA